MESLQSHCIHTQFHWSSGPPVCFPSWGTRFQSPGGTYVKPGFSCKLVSLHWWPWRDWSLWRRLRRASSQTITRPSYRQCGNPTWSHAALLSRFHAPCRSSFWLHNWHCRLLGGSSVESLQSPCIHTLLALSRYTITMQHLKQISSTLTLQTRLGTAIYLISSTNLQIFVPNGIFSVWKNQDTTYYWRKVYAKTVPGRPPWILIKRWDA